MANPCEPVIGQRSGLAWCAFICLAAAATPAWSTTRPAPEARISIPPIPAYARLYGTTCSTCHTAAPKLNVMGEAFRLNGYRLPDEPQLLRREEPVPLGEDPWKDLWPRAIWPGEIPGSFPLSVLIRSDVGFTRDESVPSSWSYEFPHEIDLLAGANLGERIAAFLEIEWSPDEGPEIEQAKVKFQDLLPWLPKRRLNLWLGLQNLSLFTFADTHLDRAARQPFAWQQARLSDIEAMDAVTGRTLRSANRLRLGQTQAAVEFNGLVTPDFYWGIGIAQGGSSGGRDDNNHKDVYYKLRYKIGGLRLDGTYRAGGGPSPGGYGQLLDRSLIIEHFGYFGAETGGAQASDPHRSFGISARALLGRLDAGVGWVHTANDDPWNLDGPAEVERTSLFGRLEYLAYPWLIGSLKTESFDVTLPPGVRLAGTTRETRIMPGLIALVRQNIRVLAEAELFASDALAAAPAERRPHALWLRLDLAF